MIRVHLSLFFFKKKCLTNKWLKKIKELKDRIVNVKSKMACDCSKDSKISKNNGLEDGLVSHQLLNYPILDHP